MRLLVFLMLAVQLLTAASTGLQDASSFVQVSNGHFQLGDSPLRFYGTNAYWLHMLSDHDLDKILYDIAAANFTVVRTWAFNDVTHKPPSGSYFQILKKNGSAIINDGPDGLQRLDKVVKKAEKYGLKLLFTLTNNWNPQKSESYHSFKGRRNGGFPRATLSNDFGNVPSKQRTIFQGLTTVGLAAAGGIDLYNRVFCSNPTHDLFYTKPEIINAFKNYLSHVIPRYANHSTVLGWEIGNDLRCSSSLPASATCNTRTITTWVADIASHIKKLDSRHLVTPGDGGFYCTSCPGIYKQERSKRDNSPAASSTFDGSYGVDTEDLISIATIDFGSFQLFPDQVRYFPYNRSDPGSTAITHGSEWIGRHSVTATTLKKPVVLTAFGIVNKDNFPMFVPFSESTPMPSSALGGGVDAFQETYAFVAWATIALHGNIGGALEYQWLDNRPLNPYRKRDAFPHYDPTSMENAGQFLPGNPSPRSGVCF